MGIRTHLSIDSELHGVPSQLEPGFARLPWIAKGTMVADDEGLIHGGYLFSAADYAAMLAVNDPNVVLGGVNCRFLKPLVVGDEVVIEARVTKVDGKKHRVTVDAKKGSILVFQGDFVCFVLPNHILSSS